jgi:hypothetical protein
VTLHESKSANDALDMKTPGFAAGRFALTDALFA